MKTQQQLIKQFHACLGSLGIRDKEQKEDIVYSATEGRATSSKDMTPAELQATILRLNGSKAAVAVGPSDKDVKNTLRRRIISKFREMGYNTFDDDKGRLVADMARIEAKMKEHWKKELNDLDKTELSKIIGVLEKEWLPHYYSTKAKKNG